MDSFWSAWSNLSNDPQDAGARSVVSEQAQELTDSFHNISQQVSQLQTGMDSAVKVQVTQINTYANQIKSLNDQITQAQVSGDNPNDLEDDRDSIVDSLSKLVNVQVVQTPNLAFPGQNVTNYKVVIGNPSSATNNVLVNGSAVYALQDPPATNASGFATVTWSDGSNVDLGTNTGTLSADITARDTDLPNFEAQMDTLANGIAQSVDAISQTGQGLQSEAMGLDFFTDGSNPATTSPPDLPTVTAATITFNPDIQADPTLIPTGAVTGTVAAAIASLANGWTGLSTQIAAGDFGTDATGVSLNPVSATSLSDLYSADVAQVGVAVQQATNMNTGAGVLLTNATNQRETVSGVSQDEEMTNLILYQKCYSAAAKMISMMDDMLDTLVNMVSTTT
ncbi:Flagellar hook-associated protein FlgK [Candidatus Desulfosporosinus infrequens]|uniref:Flagellar hook-associated protein 1 n=1 Tax=Candidatus Desulfosporosinus infrequens TaxID=2043169 RepID=A0A2U3LLL7_9FIRM|nr:Flagellar hook-associated protein FlgK [Candidatus Desulfosporosinus infrequens]